MTKPGPMAPYITPLRLYGATGSWVHPIAIA